MNLKLYLLTGRKCLEISRSKNRQKMFFTNNLETSTFVKMTYTIIHIVYYF